MSKQNPYTVLAAQRANYYLKGSPVQYVQFELLREEATGDILVTLSYKNLYQRLLTYCKVKFVCKNALGQIVAEENFVYDGIAVPEGEIFGSDEAVFVSEELVAAVDVKILEIAFENGRVHNVSAYETVKLPHLKVLSEMMAGVLGSSLRSDNVQYRPVQLEEGWQCTCGAFNYNAGKNVTSCGECGQDKAVLFSALRSAEAPADSGTKVFSAVSQPEPITGNDHTRAFAAQKPTSSRKTSKVSVMSDSTADFIIKFVPILAAGASAVYVVGAYLIKILLF